MSAPPDEREAAGGAAGDPQALDRLRRFGGGGLLAEMLAIYFDESPKRLGAARRALAAGDAAGVALAAHSLRSTSAQIGALRVARLGAEAEELARAGDLAPVPALLDAIAAEVPRFAAWVERYGRDGAVTSP